MEHRNSRLHPDERAILRKRSNSAFDFQGYQVVRSQFMQARYEGPVITISNERISFNKFCVQKFENVAFVQLLLHPTERRIAIRPCVKGDAHSIRWRPDPDKLLYSKTLNCQHFGNALFSIMEWNPDYVYKIRGTWLKERQQSIRRGFEYQEEDFFDAEEETLYEYLVEQGKDKNNWRWIYLLTMEFALFDPYHILGVEKDSAFKKLKTENTSRYSVFLLAIFTAPIVERRLGSSRPAFIYRKGERFAKGEL